MRGAAMAARRSRNSTCACCNALVSVAYATYANGQQRTCTLCTHMPIRALPARASCAFPTYAQTPPYPRASCAARAEHACDTPSACNYTHAKIAD